MIDDDTRQLRAIRFGDMDIVGTVLPAKFTTALGCIAEVMHPTFARQTWIDGPDKSKESCVLSSLAVRDFLVAIGFIAAQVRPVGLAVRAMRGDQEIHSVGVGLRRGSTRPLDPLRYWDGHMVATVDGYLIDTTLYNAARPQWPGLAGMIALPLEAPYDDLVFGMKPLAGAGMPLDGGITVELLYLDAPGNTSWRDGPDLEPRRREAAVAAMVERFGKT